MTVHALPVPELRAAARRTRSGRLKMLALLAVCAAPVLLSYLSYFVWRPEARRFWNDTFTFLAEHGLPPPRAG